GTKMSKRFGNFLTARDLREQGVDAAAVRLLVWQTHYRQPLDFNDEALEGAREGVKRLGEFHERLEDRVQSESAGPGGSGGGRGGGGGGAGGGASGEARGGAEGEPTPPGAACRWFAR